MRISELAEKADVSVRTIRYYIEEGLLPQPELKGPQTEYGSDYLVRLKLIQELKRAFLPLAEIRERIEQLSEQEIWQLLREAAETDELEVRVMSSMMKPPPLDMDFGRTPEASSYSMLLGTPSGPRPSPKPPSSTSREDADENEAKKYIGRLLQDRVEPPRAEPPRRPPSFGQWERYGLTDWLELNVRRPLDGRWERVLRRIMEAIERELGQP